jgi:hypothetical protein
MMLPTGPAKVHSGMRFRWLFVPFAASIAALGCGDKTGDSANPVVGTGGAGGTMDTDGAVMCTHDPRVDTYTANLRKSGQLHVLYFTLVESTPAPPARGSNVLKLKITDADDMPVTGDLVATLKMPDHGHPTSVQPVITLDATTSTYTIDPAYLFMPGVWLLQFAEYKDGLDAGVPTDTGSFYFCIEG